MSEAAIVHITTIGIPFYALTIIEFLFLKNQINKSKLQHSKVIPQEQPKSLGKFQLQNQPNQSILNSFINGNYQQSLIDTVLNCNQMIGNQENTIQPQESQISHKPDFEIKSTDKGQQLQKEEFYFQGGERIQIENKEKTQKDQQIQSNTNVSKPINIYQLIYNILLIVSYAVFFYGVTFSIQGHYNLKTQNFGEIIAIIIINQFCILILYNGIYPKIVKYLYINWVKGLLFKSKGQVIRFYLFSYNIFMLFVLIPSQLPFKNQEIITELVSITLAIIFQFIIAYVRKRKAFQD